MNRKLASALTRSSCQAKDINTQALNDDYIQFEAISNAFEHEESSYLVKACSILDLLRFNFQQETEIGSTTSYPGDSEILDEVITRSRGEFRHTSSPKVTSSNPPVNNRSLSQVFSPRVGELRSGQMSPRVVLRVVQTRVVVGGVP
ncbi:hypothetical protein Bca101_034707 [Brassica carinata]